MLAQLLNLSLCSYNLKNSDEEQRSKKHHSRHHYAIYLKKWPKSFKWSLWPRQRWCNLIFLSYRERIIQMPSCSPIDILQLFHLTMWWGKTLKIPSQREGDSTLWSICSLWLGQVVQESYSVYDCSSKTSNLWNLKSRITSLGCKRCGLHLTFFFKFVRGRYAFVRS